MKNIAVLISVLLLLQLLFSPSAAACPPDISVSPASIDFGSVPSGSSSSPQTVTITNDGTADLLICTISKAGPMPLISR